VKAIAWAAALALAAAILTAATSQNGGESTDNGKTAAAVVDTSMLPGATGQPDGVVPSPTAGTPDGASSADSPASPVYKLRPLPYSDAGAQMVTLEELLDLALGSNSGLLQQTNTIEKGHFAVDQTYYVFDPDFAVSLGYTHQDSGAGVSGTSAKSNSYAASYRYNKPFEYGDALSFKYDLGRGNSSGGVTPTGTEYSAGYNFSYSRPLARGAGKYINRIPRFMASNSASLAYSKYDDSVLKLKQSIIDTYYQAVSAREGISVREAGLDLALKQLERSVERFKAGLAIESDVLQSENAVLTQRSALLSARTAYKGLLDQLTSLIGLPQEYALAVDGVSSLEDIGQSIPDDLWDLVQTNSYDLKSLNTSLANLRLSRDQQLNQLRPNIGLSLSYGRTGTDATAAKAIAGNENESVQIGLNWAGKQGERSAKASVAQTDLDLASLELQLQDTELQLKTAVRGLQRDIETKRDQIGLAESNLQVLRQTYDIMTERNAAGLATALDVIKAQEDVLNGELALLQAKVAYHEAYRKLLVMAGLL
jgi:outer membrane protein TolC